MRSLVLALLLITLPACTLVGLGAGAAFDNTAGTDHIGKDVGLRIGLGIDLAVVTMVMAIFGRHR